MIEKRIHVDSGKDAVVTGYRTADVDGEVYVDIYDRKTTACLEFIRLDPETVEELREALAAASAHAGRRELTMEEPFCRCGHDESEHVDDGVHVPVCAGVIGSELCTCRGYREGRRSKELTEC